MWQPVVFQVFEDMGWVPGNVGQTSFHPFVKYHPSFVLLKWQSWWLITPEKPIRTTFDFFVCFYLV
jgi:hypothetical protein